MLVVLVPVLRRPHRVAPLLESALEATPDATVLFIPDPDDEGELAALESAGAEYLCCRGNYARKINEGVRRTDEPLIFTGADDLCFHPGWFEAAVPHLGPRVGVVGTNDLCNPRVMAGEHSTHFLVTRRYAQRGTIDEPNKLMHEGYAHEYVDNEFIETAQHRSAYVFEGEAHVEHLHPLCGKAEDDELYRGISARMRTGQRVYAQRRRLWA